MKRAFIKPWHCWIAGILAMCGTALATETQNQQLHVLPASGEVSMDASLKGWNLSGGLFACGEVEHLRDQNSLWVHAMYDNDNLYILAKWKDPTPLNNPESFGGHAFNGDCLQLRFILFPDTPNATITWWDAWRDNKGASILQRSSPGKHDGNANGIILDELRNAMEQGAKQAFFVDADGKGYTQKIAIPWKLLSKQGEAPGDHFKMTLEPNFTAGQFGRITIKDLFDVQSPKPDRIFTFRSYKDWGWATMEAKGGMTPTPVHLADGRDFSVSMVDGAPVADWTGLMQKFEWPGFKPIAFTMPMDGYISLNILNEQGQVARHLLNWDQRPAGTYTVQWDGLTDPTYRIPGETVPAGTYTWKAIVHPGANLTFRGFAGYGGRTPWDADATSCWLGDHGVPSDVKTDGKRMYLACNGAEGGRHLLATDTDGKVIWGLQNTTGAADPESIAVDNGKVYVLHPGPGKGVVITLVDADAGCYAVWQGKKDHLLTEADIFGTANPARPQLNRIDAEAGKIYLTASDDTLLVLDGASGHLIKSMPLAKGGALKAVSENLVYVISGGTSVLAVDPATGENKVVIANLFEATGINTDTTGNIYVSLDGPTMQVAEFDPQGKEIKRIGRPGGRAPLGAWQADGMLYPAGIAIDPTGRLWVAERDRFPKRVSVWSMTDGTLQKDFFGPAHYGASGGAINPRDPNLMIGEGCEWRLDPNSGKAACVGTIDRHLHGFATFREGSNGKLYLFTIDSRYGLGAVDVWERLGDANYQKRAELRNNGGAGARTAVWVDANGDGKEQPEELQSQPAPLFFSGSNDWSLNLGPDMAFYAFDGAAKRLKVLSINGFTSCNAPKYDLANAKLLPEAMSEGYQPNYSCAVPSADNKRILINLAAPNHPAHFLWTCFDLQSGQNLWTYPNAFFQVHGSHLAPAYEPGLFRGAYGPVGTATFPAIGDIWFINGNVGEWGVLSSDGFYVTRLFDGNVFDWKWPKEATPGVNMDNLPPGSGGEDFGGSVTQASDGNVYVQAGKSADWNLKLSGLDKSQALTGQSFTLSEADLKTAASLRDGEMQNAVGAVTASAAPASIRFTGHFNEDFKGCQLMSYQKSADSAVQTAIAYDQQMLYVGWEVNDPTPWVNGAKDMSQMYAGGDTVDLQLGLDPAANPKRGAAGKGDIRISVGNLQGTPTAVLYRFVSDVKKPRVFTSGVVRGYQVDYVDVLSDAKIVVTPQKNKYLVELAVPTSTLGIVPLPGLSLRGDVGVTFGEASGTRTKLRSYWSNQETGLVDDVVFELQVTPKNWGTIVFK